MAIDPSRQVPGEAVTSNELFFDALVRHQIGLLRLSGSIRNDIFKIMDATEADIAATITKRLAGRTGLNTPVDVRRMQSLLKAIRAPRLKAWDDITELWVKELTDLAVAEPLFVDAALKTVVPVILSTTIPATALLKSIVTFRPFEGKTLRQWASSIKATDLRRIEDQIRIGMIQGESSAAIARRVVGTARQRGRDGITEISRRAAAGITRTAVIGISNQAKREFYKANSSLFTEELYVATLDARTTPICRSLDGKTFPIGIGPIPPLHFNCRSVRIAIIDAQVIGNRPAKPVTQQILLREFSAQQGISPAVTSRAALPRGTKGMFDTFSQARIRELTGTIPAKVSYQTWLGRQSVMFQDDVLGKARGRLFRRGNLTLDRFVNRQGDEILLSQLAQTDREAFIAAGLDPEDFL